MYIEIQKVMYGLTQSGELTNDKLNLHLYIFGYELSPITPGLWQHQTCSLQFSLVVDDFELKYDRQADINHLLDVLNTIYRIYEYWGGKLYCGIILE